MVFLVLRFFIAECIIKGDDTLPNFKHDKEPVDTWVCDVLEYPVPEVIRRWKIAVIWRENSPVGMLWPEMPHQLDP
ncbi:hypothetical protein Tco_0721246 [Tanacetum coccineum]